MIHKGSCNQELKVGVFSRDGIALSLTFVSSCSKAMKTKIIRFQVTHRETFGLVLHINSQHIKIGANFNKPTKRLFNHKIQLFFRQFWNLCLLSSIEFFRIILETHLVKQTRLIFLITYIMQCFYGKIVVVSGTVSPTQEEKRVFNYLNF